jgi:L-glyceraldehyde 3-phosphate reductase
MCSERGRGLHRVQPARLGLLSDRYLRGIPTDSRAARDFSSKKDVDERRVAMLRELNAVAKQRDNRWLRWPSPGCCAIRASPAR